MTPSQGAAVEKTPLTDAWRKQIAKDYSIEGVLDEVAEMELALQRRDALLREAAVYLSEWSGAGNKEAGKLWKRIGIELSSK